MSITPDELKQTLERINKMGGKAPAKPVAVVKKEGGQTGQKPPRQYVKQLAKEFAYYKLWLTLPDQLRGQSRAQLEKLGVHDEELLNIISCATQTDFAERFKVRRQTLSDWNKQLKLDPDVIDGYARELQALTKNIAMAVYLNALKTGNPEAWKTWMIFIHGWNPKEKIEHTVAHFDVVGFIEQIEERNRRIRDGLPANELEHDEDDEY